MSNIKEIKAELNELRRKIRTYSKQYYDENASDISDYDFDMLMQRLKKIEAEYPELITKNSPTQKVGGTAQREVGVLVPHDVPMLSLQDVFSEEEIRAFVTGVLSHFPTAEFVVEELTACHLHCAMRTACSPVPLHAATARYREKMSR